MLLKRLSPYPRGRIEEIQSNIRRDKKKKKSHEERQRRRISIALQGPCCREVETRRTHAGGPGWPNAVIGNKVLSTSNSRILERNPFVRVANGIVDNKCQLFPFDSHHPGFVVLIPATSLCLLYSTRIQCSQ